MFVYFKRLLGCLIRLFKKLFKVLGDNNDFFFFFSDAIFRPDLLLLDGE